MEGVYSVEAVCSSYEADSRAGSKCKLCLDVLDEVKSQPDGFTN